MTRTPSRRFVAAIAFFLGATSVSGTALAQTGSAPRQSSPTSEANDGGLDVETFEVSLSVEWDDDPAVVAALLGGDHHGEDHPNGGDTPGLDGAAAAVRIPTSGTSLALDGEATMVIVEAAAGANIGTLAVRSQNDGAWSDWIIATDSAEEAPDGLGTEEGSAASASGVGPIWIGENAEAVQIARLGQTTAAITVEALTPRPELQALAQSSTDDLVGQAAAQPGQPTILPRSAWTTADWAFGNQGCDTGPILARNVEAVVVHHTVTTNSYGADTVAGQIEGIRRFHTNTKGWCDIAYNFIVDRFGRIWEARMGGVDQPVSGGHARGFNTATAGVAVLGTHTSEAAPGAVVGAISALADWKLGLHGADPLGTVWLKSRTGSTGVLRYPNGTWVDTPRLVGHRDLVLTSCPGDGLYPSIAPIRNQIALTADEPPYDFVGRRPLDSGPAVFVTDVEGTVRPAGAADVPSSSPAPLVSGSAIAIDGANGRGFVLVNDGTVVGFGGNQAPSERPGGDRTVVDLVATQNGARGWVVDVDGEMHGFGGAGDLSPATSPSQAIAAALDDNGTGYVLGRDGSLHSLAGAPSRSIATAITAVDIGLMSDGVSGWVLDSTGKLHPFGDAPSLQSDLAGAAGDRARAVLVDPTDRGGWVLDSEGRLYAFGQLRRVQPITTTVGTPTIMDAGLWWHLPADLLQFRDPAHTAALFELFFGRTGSLEEIDYWTWVIEDTSVDDVADEFANSEEWAGVIVDDIYTDVLGRAPDQEGKQYWVQRLNDGLRTQDLGTLFYASPEYVEAAGSNTAYVTLLYRALLHREPDAVGLDYWVTRLDSGAANPGDIASGFYQSVESRNDRVTRLYFAILERGPDEEGRDFWAGRLLAEDDIALAVDLAVSDEFRDRVTAGLDR